MTFFLPLDQATSLPSAPSFLVPSSEPVNHLNRVIKSIMKARRIAVVCGAGISVQAGIPDFRSSEGLFQSLKKDNPALSSGKDLFDASVFNAEDTTALFCQMIAQLSELSESAEPTPFHKLLRALDDRGKLLRVYTQNIDALESKSGLTFGVPKPPSSRSKPRSAAGPSTPTPSSPRLASPPVEIPRVIPLHGTLETLHCVSCTHAYPLRDHLALLTSGIPPHCPDCTLNEENRQYNGKRLRGVGKLRPSVVLYNEVHKDGEEVGEAVRKDLIGNSKGKGRPRSGADLLLVVGTSLRVPGTKRIVREFSKVVRSRSTGSSNDGYLPTPSPSPRRSPDSVDEDGPVTSVYLNLDFPVPTREWEGVFDVWIKGDAQTFAHALKTEMDKEARAKEAALERKRLREEAESRKAAGSKKRKASEVVFSKTATNTTKKRKVEVGRGAKKLTIKIPARPGTTLATEVVLEVGSPPYTPPLMPLSSSISPVSTPKPVPSKSKVIPKKKLVRKRSKIAIVKKKLPQKPKSKAPSPKKRITKPAATQPVQIMRQAQYGLRDRGSG